MEWKKVKISEVKPNPENPRKISSDKFEKLVDSIKKFPEMLELRPIVVNRDMVVLGGNMRLRACEKAGLKEIPIVYAESLTPEQEREFVAKDNISFGEFDWEIIRADWDLEELSGWGLDVPDFSSEEQRYSTLVKSPLYEAKNEKPLIKSLFDPSKHDRLIEKINESAIDEEMKGFLRVAASRHIVFDYSKIADFYAHSEKPVQELMEDSALVIIDFKRAIELGFVKLYETLSDLADGEE